MSDCDPRPHVLSALRAHQARLRRYVAARVPAGVVEDVCQAAALRAIERAASLRDPERVVPWLYRIHANVAKDTLRAELRDRRLVEAMGHEAMVDATGSGTLQDDPPCACSVAQTRQLPPNYMSILALVDIGDMSLREAARTLSITVNNATVRLHRARLALKKRLRSHCGVTSVSACAECACTYRGCCAT
ncbi:MAG: RNA polymerase sigma factor [Pseudomonadota bacterium]